MALANHTRPAPFGAIAISNLVAFAESAWTKLVDWNTQRRTRDMLAKLSDRELADIGLIRGDLENLPSRF